MPSDIDGVVSFAAGDSIGVRSVAQALGLESCNWYVDLFGGGSYSCASVANAAMAVALGLCRHVLVFRATEPFGRTAAIRPDPNGLLERPLARICFVQDVENGVIGELHG